MRFNYSSKRDLYYEKAMKLYFEEGMCGSLFGLLFKCIYFQRNLQIFPRFR